MKAFVLLSIAILGCTTSKKARRFPDDFMFGAATAAYQVEGGWDADDKGESIWDHITHTKPHVINDFSNGDIAADSFHNYKRDVEMIRELGLDAYRFSLSWARILPNGFTNKVSKAGLQYYNNLIDELLKYGIKPIVTLYHWDLPQLLQDLGGFQNALFPEWFEDYARVAFEHFGDRVKFWITFNEPREICFEGYESNTKAPMLNATDIGTYLCAYHLLLAHARAYYVYFHDFKEDQDGVCGITISVNWFAPGTDSEEDHFAAEVRRQAEWGLYAEPIFSKDGGFPKELSEIVAKRSAEQGYAKSRLPELTEEERYFIRSSSDFFGVNHYTACYISATKHLRQYPVPSLYDDAGFGIYVGESWPHSASSWLRQAPDSINKTVTYLAAKYDNPTIYITENGWSQIPSVGLVDDGRIRYHRAALESALDAIDAGVKLKGYMAWSLMDNFEWMAGYTERFGLYEVNFQDPARPRTPRKSAFVYKHIIKTRMIDHDYKPDTMTMWIDEGH